MPPALLASSNFTDPEHERLIWFAAGGLVLLGVLLTVVTVLWWRGTKGEHAALAPLEVMGDRSFPTLTHVEQSRRLDAVRLQLEGDVEPDAVAADDAVDLDEALRSFQPGFDDLRDQQPAVAPEPSSDGAVPTPAAVPRIAVQVVGKADESETLDADAATAPAHDEVAGESADDDDVPAEDGDSPPAAASAAEVDEASDDVTDASAEAVEPPTSTVIHDQDAADPPADDQSDAARPTNRTDRAAGANGTDARRTSAGDDDLHSIDPMLAGEPVDS